MPYRNQQIVLASRPQGMPSPDNFKLVDSPVPDPGPGQMCLRTLYLSLDPYMRGRMSDQASYAEPTTIGQVMVGGTVSQVVSSQISRFKQGDVVLSQNGWQQYALSDGTEILKLDPSPTLPLSYALGVLGMPGFTAYTGLLEIGKPRPGETVVVSAASGAVGSVVGQIAKIKGCRAVGIAGSKTKCDHVTQTLGFDACLNYKEEDFKERLRKACPNGVDVYFENVGGKVQQTVLPLMTIGARIPLCGLISQYNATDLPEGPDRTPLLMAGLLVKRIMIRGFIIFDHKENFPVFQQEMKQWLTQGLIRYKEDQVTGLEEAPEAFIGLLQGRSFGKLLVKVADPQ